MFRNEGLKSWTKCTLNNGSIWMNTSIQVLTANSFWLRMHFSVKMDHIDANKCNIVTMGLNFMSHTFQRFSFNYTLENILQTLYNQALTGNKAAVPCSLYTCVTFIMGRSIILYSICLLFKLDWVRERKTWDQSLGEGDLWRSNEYLNIFKGSWPNKTNRLVGKLNNF